MKRITDTARVSYEVAKARALTALTDQPLNAASIAAVIWPDNTMHAQGAGGAASRILKRMEAEGLAKWTSTRYRWGWVRCARVTDRSKS